MLNIFRFCVDLAHDLKRSYTMSELTRSLTILSIAALAELAEASYPVIVMVS